MEQRTPQDMENEFTFPDGTVGWFDLRISPVPEGIFILSTDITERKMVEEELEETKARLEAILNQMPVGIMVADARSGEILFANDEIESIYGLGFKPTDIKGFVDYTRLARRHLDGRSYHTEEYPLVRALKGDVIRNEMAAVLRPDGNKVFINGSSAPVYDPHGNIVASVALSIDVTEQVKAQRDRDRLLAETEVYSKKLLRSNNELQQFAYAASHDLQEPLRMITVYLGLLESKYGDRLDGKAKQYMDYAVEGGKRAKDLVRDLLEFSRVDTQGKPFQDTNLDKVLEAVLVNLAVRIKDENAVVSHDPLPTVLADELQMAQVLQNLIGNAIKFHGAESPTVHISGRDDGDKWLFSIRDNGIGIDPEYKDKIFVLFQRLHSREEYDGTGIGLAISKKIVERHGGRIWFNSRPGSGTIFYFTIPKEARS